MIKVTLPFPVFLPVCKIVLRNVGIILIEKNLILSSVKIILFEVCLLINFDMEAMIRQSKQWETCS